MNHGSLFSGIGGFELAAQWMGWHNIFHCEIDLFCRKVLNYHWPQSKAYEDIKATDFTVHRGAIDILTGGFPCQPYSSAGKRKGKEDDRHLWPAMHRAIREIRPRWVVGENVRGILNWAGGLAFEQVQADLENEGYEVQSYLLPAAGVNAPHRRDRVWIVAYADNSDEGRTPRKNEGEGKKEKILEWDEIQHFNQSNQVFKDAVSCEKSISEKWSQFPTQPALCSGDDGLPSKLDGITVPKWRNESIKAFGNAIVPQVAFQLFKVIGQMEQRVYSRNYGN